MTVLPDSARPSTLPFGRPSRSDAILDELQKRHPFPLNAMLAITERCNLRCEHCYLPQERDASEMTLAEIERVLDELAAAGVLLLTITGGEPALRDDLKQIVEAAVLRRFAVKLKTNATLLDDRRVERLAEAGLAEVHVSIHDIHPPRHDRFVGRAGSWELAIAAARAFRQRGISVVLAAQVMEPNADSITAIVDLCERSGFGYIVDPRVSPGVDGSVAPCAFRARSDQLVRLLGDPRLFDREAFLASPSRRPDDALCSAAHGTAHIRPDGDVLLCQFLPWSLGNALLTPFRELWLDSPIRRRFADLRWSDLPQCSACDLAWACTRCSGVALIEAGDETAASATDCRIARARAEACGRPGHGGSG